MCKDLSVLDLLVRHGLVESGAKDVKICECNHRLAGTGAAFLQSLGLIHCNVCNGWQAIRKPVL